MADDFARVGSAVGAAQLPTLIVQEGGYNTRSLGRHARYFFGGLASHVFGPRAMRLAGTR